MKCIKKDKNGENDTEMNINELTHQNDNDDSSFYD